MDLFSTQDFPLIESDCNLFFQEELVFFYFHNYRDSSFSDTVILSNRFGRILQLLKENLHNSVSGSFEYLILFYRLLGHTRFTLYGKGEHELSYLMLWNWYTYFPTLAIYAVHRFVKCVDGQISSFGSWRDIKYLCQFISKHSDLQQDHSFIDVCCDLMNSQLDIDLDIQHMSAIPNPAQSISNVAKWVPREHKQFDWLYNKLVTHWIRKNKPYILNTATDLSYFSAISKSKRIYRKKISFLNKIIDTTQIKLCARNRQNILPNHVSRYTQMKLPNLLLEYGDTRQLSSERFTNWVHSNCNSNCSNNTTVAPLPIYHYVKRAFQLLSNHPNRSDKSIVSLDKQWTLLSNTFNHSRFGNSIPVIDVSDRMYNMNSDSYYAGIGYAILFAQNSSFSNRILAVDDLPTWIHFDTNQGFVSIVEQIQLSIYSSSCSHTNFHAAFHLIGKTIQESMLNHHNVRHLRIVIFSTFSQSDHSLYDNILSILNNYCFHIPFIAFWNLSKSGHDILPCSIHQHSALLLSGFSPCLLHTLLDKYRRFHTTPYKTICNILRHTNYDVLENYICKLRQS
jgi:hypothetical protein